METGDRQLMICGRWAVASDGVQWILQRQVGSYWRNVTSVRSTKDILARCMREKGCPPEVAQRLLEACSRRFAEAPYGRATRPEKIASCTLTPKRPRHPQPQGRYSACTRNNPIINFEYSNAGIKK
jgi:hypothetical protein